MKSVTALALLIAGLAVIAQPAMANTPTSNEVSKKATAKKAAAAKKEAQAEDDDQPDVKNMKATAFDCELGNKLTIYSDAADEQQIALHWNKRMHRMQRVSTTTGAHRFENAKNGLVWIGIPAKGMLLDSKKGKQLANECRSPEQQAQKMAEG
ncbi:hypothetical protein [Noviherbaspirillum sp.]|uniref:hypothetical protein n=1 Tax=Noviherbaspirillum sp. TaxID=1926288 RepID=UPI002D6ED4F0|nr:hypothetical protein [Noviherbaspirillum sp.]HZW20458.1 hypothetical protein [Noviherbaspirillum sp.]